MFPIRETVVAIPVCNEEVHLTACLRALDAQTIQPDRIVLLLNNCTDRSLDICSGASRHSPALHLVECQLNGDDASAGEARRRAIGIALAFAGEGVVLTTDADAIVPPSWVADNLGEIAAGADCVCGMAIIGERTADIALPRLKFDEMRESLLLALQDEIVSIVDPEAADPWPRHQQHSGASLAFKAAALRRAGGAPRVASGEDRALIAALAAIDARIRHAPHIQVLVSGRMQGRAAGGMAETMRRRLNCNDHLTDDRLEPTLDAYRRVLARARLRASDFGAAGDNLATDLLISKAAIRVALETPFFGRAWKHIQRESSVLHRRRVPFGDLARETRQAFALLDYLREVVGQTTAIAPMRRLRHAI